MRLQLKRPWKLLRLLKPRQLKLRLLRKLHQLPCLHLPKVRLKT